ncbi:hypothetical protein [Adlercreutzia agrestimuris]|uniref:hypothetical protein n=1 Tax=Adlercreutzia agrestimuris TaxID=2941324 RepID=UPI00203E6A75|nr:hypothetical protein [Adlercreutzia agrestimuris]
MLKDCDAFSSIENTLREVGTLDAFEKENGVILGRAMIVEGEIPEGVVIKGSGKPQAFICTFDFFDCEMGIALDVVTKEPMSGIWITPQIEDAEPPTEEWVEFFIDKLMGSVSSKGSYGTPVYSFVNNETDLTVIPTESEK